MYLDNEIRIQLIDASTGTWIDNNYPSWRLSRYKCNQYTFRLTNTHSEYPGIQNFDRIVHCYRTCFCLTNYYNFEPIYNELINIGYTNNDLVTLKYFLESWEIDWFDEEQILTFVAQMFSNHAVPIENMNFEIIGSNVFRLTPDN